jgi:16S rRNA C967 or C1407 C5-methylase (RsmB/RsmF family)
MTWTLFDERYRNIIPDYEGFLKALEDDLPVAMNDTFLKEIGSRDGLSLKQTFGEFSFYEAQGLKKHWGGKIEHHLGLYYMQALSSLLPVYALAPEKGDAVLDMCSAPGGKSALIAELMESTGPLICNEPDLNRRRVLKANLERMGVFNAATFDALGESLPFKEASFDKILLDGPCSSEGTLRKSHLGMKKRKLGNFVKYNKDFRVRLQKTQYELLTKAIYLLTCLFNLYLRP